MDYTVWINREFVPRSQATISVRDRGLRFGDLVFDTSRTFNGEVFRLRDHLKRLYRSLQYTRIDSGMSLEEMERLTLEVVRRNEPAREKDDDYMVTQMVTRGVGTSIRALSAKKATLIIWIDPIDWVMYAPAYQFGVPLVIPKTRSHSPEQLDPKVKNFNRLHMAMADLEATDVDPDALPLLMDSQGNITESIGANFFIVTNGTLKTPTDRATLQGVSRQAVMEMAGRLGIPVAEEDFQPHDVYSADEAFLTSTPYSILPVGRVDKRKIGEQVPGPITKHLLAAWSEMVDMDIVGQFINRAKLLQGRVQ